MKAANDELLKNGGWLGGGPNLEDPMCALAPYDLTTFVQKDWRLYAKFFAIRLSVVDDYTHSTQLLDDHTNILKNDLQVGVCLWMAARGPESP